MVLSIIIVNWNSRDFLRQCLASLSAHPPSSPFETIVIDSASYDGAAEMVATEFPGVRFIQSDENLGFARANNLAAKSATGEFLLFLNPDTEVHPASLDRLIDAAATVADAGCVGARLLNTDGSLQTSCVQAFPTVLNQVFDSEFLRRRFRDSPWWGVAALYRPSADPAPVEGISGACVLVRRALFEQVRGFTEAYFMYAEDMDLSYKVQRSGRRNLYVGQAVVVHHGGESSKKAPSNFSVVLTREALRKFFLLHHNAFSAFGYRIGMGVTAISRITLLHLAGLIRRGGPADTQAHSLRKWRAVRAWAWAPAAAVRLVLAPK